MFPPAPVAQPTPPPAALPKIAAPKVDPNVLYKVQIAEMKLMGFDESKIVKALDDESGNIDRAIDRLMD